jgi:glucokinase
MAEALAIGVDVGGTKVAAGLVRNDGAILFQTRAPMAATGTATEGLASVRAAIEAVLAAQPAARNSIAGIGIGSPGPLDPEGGVIVNPRNVPCWRDYPLVTEVVRAFHMPARLDNDGNAAGLGEALWGAGAGYRNVFYVTLGTGVGTAIVFDKRIHHGRTGNAGEGGHVSINYRGPQCNCGKRGCIEVYCAGPGIARRARERVAHSGGAASRITALVNGKLDEVRAETVGEAHRQGDPVARELLEETADLLAVWLGNVVDMLEPDVIVVGGGVSEILGEFLPRIRQRIPQWSINPRSGEIPILPARYGTESGIAGAAALILAPQPNPREE